MGLVYLLSCIEKEMMGGWREILVNELQVTPLFRTPLLDVTTTTASRERRERGAVEIS